jgi:hypothetical protein
MIFFLWQGSPGLRGDSGLPGPDGPTSYGNKGKRKLHFEIIDYSNVFFLLYF